MFLTNKRGQEDILKNVFYIIFIIAILLILIYFLQNTIKGEDIQKQVTAKQISLLLDAAEPNTAFSLQHANLTVTKGTNNIQARTNLPFVYDFFNPYNINFNSEGGKTQIEVLRK